MCSAVLVALKSFHAATGTQALEMTPWWLANRKGVRESSLPGNFKDQGDPCA